MASEFLEKRAFGTMDKLILFSEHSNFYTENGTKTQKYANNATYSKGKLFSNNQIHDK